MEGTGSTYIDGTAISTSEISTDFSKTYIGTSDTVVSTETGSITIDRSITDTNSQIFTTTDMEATITTGATDSVTLTQSSSNMLSSSLDAIGRDSITSSNSTYSTKSSTSKFGTSTNTGSTFVPGSDKDLTDNDKNGNNFGGNISDDQVNDNSNDDNSDNLEPKQVDSKAEDSDKHISFDLSETNLEDNDGAKTSAQIYTTISASTTVLDNGITYTGSPGKGDDFDDLASITNDNSEVDENYYNSIDDYGNGGNIKSINTWYSYFIVLTLILLLI